MSEIHRYDLFSGDNLLTPEHRDSHRCRDGEWVQYESHARIVADLRAALAKAEQDIEDRDRAIESLRLKVDTAHGQIDAMKATIRDREAEILRIQTHETAAVHALDSTLTPEERATFKSLADENATLTARAERLAAECRAGRRVECSALGDGSSAELADRLVELEAARAAVDAHGDLEVPK